jgi:uncharacterized Tic20 family protein
MDQSQADRRPCATCGGVLAPDDVTCATCGQPYIPDTSARASTPPPPGSAPPTPRPPAAQRPPASPAVTDTSRTWAAAAHASAIAGVFLGGLPAFLGPLVVWLVRRDAGDQFATDHAREALNFNLSVIIYAVVAGVLSVVTLGLALLVVVPAAAIAFVAYLVVSVQATLAASRGTTYRYPLTMRLVS